MPDVFLEEMERRGIRLERAEAPPELKFTPAPSPDLAPDFIRDMERRGIRLERAEAPPELKFAPAPSPKGPAEKPLGIKHVIGAGLRGADIWRPVRETWARPGARAASWAAEKLYKKTGLGEALAELTAFNEILQQNPDWANAFYPKVLQELKSLVRGTYQAASSAPRMGQQLLNRVASGDLLLGDALLGPVADFYSSVPKSIPPGPKFTEEPFNPRVYTTGAAEALPSYGVMIAGTLLGGPVAGALAGAALEQTGYYEELRESGVPEEEAFVRATVYGGVSLILNKIGLEKMLDVRVADTLKQKILKALGASGLELVTEYWEEVYTSLEKFANSIVDTGRPDWDGLDQDLVEGLNVIPGAAVLGGGISAGAQAVNTPKEQRQIRRGLKFLGMSDEEIDKTPRAQRATIFRQKVRPLIEELQAAVAEARKADAALPRNLFTGQPLDQPPPAPPPLPPEGGAGVTGTAAAPATAPHVAPRPLPPETPTPETSPRTTAEIERGQTEIDELERRKAGLEGVDYAEETGTETAPPGEPGPEDQRQGRVRVRQPAEDRLETPAGKIEETEAIAAAGGVTREGKPKSWQDHARVIDDEVNKMPAEQALQALDEAMAGLREAKMPDTDRKLLLDRAARRREAIAKDVALQKIADEKGREFFDVDGWLAPDFGDQGLGHVMAGDVLVDIAVDGDGVLDPAYNVDEVGIFVNRGPGQAARIRLQNRAGMVPLIFNEAELDALGISVQKGAEAVIDQPIPLRALTPEAKLRAVDAILNELDYQGRAITDAVVAKIANALGIDTDVVRARINPKAVAIGKKTKAQSRAEVPEPGVAPSPTEAEEVPPGAPPLEAGGLSAPGAAPRPETEKAAGLEPGAPSGVPGSGEVKPVWTSTRAEFLARNKIDPATTPAKKVKKALQAHRRIIERALRDGQPVPDEVLAEYPDLADPAQRERLLAKTRQIIAKPETRTPAAAPEEGGPGQAFSLAAKRLAEREDLHATTALPLDKNAVTSLVSWVRSRFGRRLAVDIQVVDNDLHITLPSGGRFIVRAAARPVITAARAAEILSRNQPLLRDIFLDYATRTDQDGVPVLTRDDARRLQTLLRSFTADGPAPVDAQGNPLPLSTADTALYDAFMDWAKNNIQVRGFFLPTGRNVYIGSDGREHPIADVIVLIAGNARSSTFTHELLHLAREWGLFSDAEWAALKRKYAPGVTDEARAEDLIAEGMERNRGFWEQVRDYLIAVLDLLSFDVSTLAGVRAETRFRSGALFGDAINRRADAAGLVPEYAARKKPKKPKPPEPHQMTRDQYVASRKPSTQEETNAAASRHEHFVRKAFQQGLHVPDFYEGVEDDYPELAAQYPDPARLLVRGAFSKAKSDARADIDAMTGPVPDLGQNVTDKDIYTHFNEKRRAQGIIHPLQFTDAYREILASTIASMAHFMTRRLGGQGLPSTWYTAKVEAAVRKTAERHPELLQGGWISGNYYSAADHRAMWALSMAATSNGKKVPVNYRFGEQIYSEWKTTGRLPNFQGKDFGKETRSANKALTRFQTLIEQGGGVSNMRRFMVAVATAGELKQLGYTTPELVDSEFRGSLILGAKLGAFFANVFGIHEALTADRWWVKTFSRARGYNWGLMPEERLLKKARKILGDRRRSITLVGGFTQDQLLADDAALIEYLRIAHEQWASGLPYVEGKREPNPYVQREGTGKDAVFVIVDPETKERIGRKTYATRAEAIRSTSIPAPYRAEITYGKKSPFNTALARLGRDWHKHITTVSEKPGGGGDRKFMWDVAARAVEIMKDRYGVATTVADLQADVWYFEKILVFRFKNAAKLTRAELDAYNPLESYAEAAEAYAKALEAGEDIPAARLVHVETPAAPLFTEEQRRLYDELVTRGEQEFPDLDAAGLFQPVTMALEARVGSSAKAAGVLANLGNHDYAKWYDHLAVVMGALTNRQGRFKLPSLFGLTLKRVIQATGSWTPLTPGSVTENNPVGIHLLNLPKSAFRADGSLKPVWDLRLRGYVALWGLLTMQDAAGFVYMHPALPEIHANIDIGRPFTRAEATAVESAVRAAYPANVYFVNTPVGALILNDAGINPAAFHATIHSIYTGTSLTVHATIDLVGAKSEMAFQDWAADPSGSAFVRFVHGNRDITRKSASRTIRKVGRGVHLYAKDVDAAVQAWARRENAGDWPDYGDPVKRPEPVFYSAGRREVGEEPRPGAARARAARTGTYDEQLKLAFPDLDDAERRLGSEALADLESLGRNVRTRLPGIRLVASRLARRIARTGYIELRGASARTPAEVAGLLQVFRDPRFETFRFIWVKDGKVVAHEAFTSGLPHTTAWYTEKGATSREKLKKHITKMRDRKVRLGADGYYLAHNHPTGLVQPSDADFAVNKVIAKNVPGYLGHIIIDHDKYALIDRDNISLTHDVPERDVRTIEGDPGRASGAADPLLDLPVTTPDQAAQAMARLHNDPTRVTVVFRDASNRIAAIMDMARGVFNTDESAIAALRGQAKFFSSDRINLGFSRDSLSQNQMDAVYDLLNTNRILSAVEIGPDGAVDVHMLASDPNKADIWPTPIPRLRLHEPEPRYSAARREAAPTSALAVRKKTPVWVSGLKTFITENISTLTTKKRSIPASALLAKIEKDLAAGKFKKLEFQDLGLGKWLLDKGDDPVTAEELQEFADLSLSAFKEKIRSDLPQAQGPGWVVVGGPLDRTFDTREDAQAWVDQEAERLLVQRHGAWGTWRVLPDPDTGAWKIVTNQADYPDYISEQEALDDREALFEQMVRQYQDGFPVEQAQERPAQEGQYRVEGPDGGFPERFDTEAEADDFIRREATGRLLINHRDPQNWTAHQYADGTWTLKDGYGEIFPARMGLAYDTEEKALADIDTIWEELLDEAVDRYDVVEAEPDEELFAPSARDRSPLHEGESYNLSGEYKDYIELLLIDPELDWSVEAHFPEKGVLGWIRANARNVLAAFGGGTAFHIEESQSDIHQEARKQGAKAVKSALKQLKEQHGVKFPHPGKLTRQQYAGKMGQILHESQKKKLGEKDVRSPEQNALMLLRRGYLRRLYEALEMTGYKEPLTPEQEQKKARVEAALRKNRDAAEEALERVNDAAGTFFTMYGMQNLLRNNQFYQLPYIITAAVGNTVAPSYDHIDPERRRELMRNPRFKEIEKAMPALRNAIRRHEAAVAAYNRMTDRFEKGVPKARFSKNWHLVLFKRALREAVDQGHDWVTWTTGVQQVERWQSALRQKVKGIYWKAFAETGLEDRRHVDVKFKDGRTVRFSLDEDGDVISTSNAGFNQAVGKEAAELFGAQMAEQIMEQTSGAFEGENITIGGAGFEGFYDQIMVSEANAYLKKWGIRAEKVKIGKTVEPGWEVRDEGGRFQGRYKSREEAEKNIRTMADDQVFDRYGHWKYWQPKPFPKEDGFYYGFQRPDGGSFGPAYDTAQEARADAEHQYGILVDINIQGYQIIQPQMAQTQHEVWGVRITPELRAHLAGFPQPLYSATRVDQRGKTEKERNKLLGELAGLIGKTVNLAWQHVFPDRSAPVENKLKLTNFYGMETALERKAQKYFAEWPETVEAPNGVTVRVRYPQKDQAAIDPRVKHLLRGAEDGPILEGHSVYFNSTIETLTNPLFITWTPGDKSKKQRPGFSYFRVYDDATLHKVFVLAKSADLKNGRLITQYQEYYSHTDENEKIVWVREKRPVVQQPEVSQQPVSTAAQSQTEVPPVEDTSEEVRQPLSGATTTEDSESKPPATRTSTQDQSTTKRRGRQGESQARNVPTREDRIQGTRRAFDQLEAEKEAESGETPAETFTNPDGSPMTPNQITREKKRRRDAESAARKARQGGPQALYSAGRREYRDPDKFAYRRSGLTAGQKTKVIAAMRAMIPETENPLEARWLLPDGTWLATDTPGDDHDMIVRPALRKAGIRIPSNAYYAGVNAALGAGAVRISPDWPAVNIGSPPTAAQRQAIEELILMAPEGRMAAIEVSSPRENDQHTVYAADVERPDKQAIRRALAEADRAMTGELPPQLVRYSAGKRPPGDAPGEAAYQQEWVRDTVRGIQEQAARNWINDPPELVKAGMEILRNLPKLAKNLRDPDENTKPDLTVLDFIRMPQHLEKAETFYRGWKTTETRVDEKNRFDHIQFNSFPGQDSDLTRWTRLRRKFPKQYRAALKYLVGRDQNAWSYKVRQNKKTNEWEVLEITGRTFILRATLPRPKGAPADWTPPKPYTASFPNQAMLRAKAAQLRGQGWKTVSDYQDEYRVVDRAQDEEAAWSKAYELEQRDLESVNMPAEARAAILAWRRVMDRNLVLRMGQIREVIEVLGEDGLTEDEQQGRNDLENLILEMGQLRGHYFPRQYGPGRFVLIATKGDERVIKTYDTRAMRAAQATVYQARGYQTRFKQSEQTSEDAFRKTGTILAKYDEFQHVIDRLQEKTESEEAGFEAFGMTVREETYTTKKGETEVWLKVEAPNTKAYTDVFMAIPGHGAWDGDQTEAVQAAGRKVWSFPNPSPELKRSILAGYSQNWVQRETINQFAQAFLQEWADQIRAHGAQAAKIARGRGVGLDVARGYEQDPVLAMTRAVTSTSGGLAKGNMARRMLQIFTGTEQSWKEYKQEHADELKGLTGPELAQAKRDQWLAYQAQVNERRISSSVQPYTYKAAAIVYENAMRNETGIERIVGVWRGLTAAKYLSRVFSAFINTTILQTTLPAVLHGFHNVSFAATQKAMGRVLVTYPEYWKARWTGRRYTGNPELARVYDYVYDRGWAEAQFNREAVQAVQNKFGRGISQTIDALTLVFSTSETYIRLTSIATAYLTIQRRMEKAGQWTEASFEAAMAEAKAASDKTNQVYHKANIPVALQGPGWGKQIGRSWYMFQRLTHGQLDVLVQLGLKKKDARAVAWMLAAPAILAGPAASYGWPVVLAAVNAVLAAIPGVQPPEDDPEAWLWNQIAQWLGKDTQGIMRYGFAGAFGANIQGSLALMQRLPEWPDDLADVQLSLEDIGGAPVSALSDVWRGGKRIAGGDWYRGAEEMGPSIVSSALRGFREYRQGVTGADYQRRFYGTDQVQPDAWDTFIRILGGNPRKISEKFTEQYGERVVAENYGDIKTDIRNRLIRWYGGPELAYTQRDGAEYAEILVLVKGFNDRHARFRPRGVTPITDDTIRTWLRNAYTPAKAERERTVH